MGNIGKKFWYILIAGIVLRLVLSAVTYHSDIQPFDLAGYVIGKGNILNYYDYLPSLPADSPVLKAYPSNLFNYPPAVYFFLGVSSLALTGWADSTFHEAFLFSLEKSLNPPDLLGGESSFNVPEVLGNVQFFLHLILLKTPFLIFDIALGFLFIRLFDSEKKKILAFILWIFNPISLYAIYMVGQFDVIPAFFTILALYLVVKNPEKLKSNLYLSALALGVGAAFKIYPLFLLPAVASLTDSWRKRIGIIALGILPYILIILPFLPSKGFRATALVAGQTLKSLYPQIPVSGGESIMLFLALMVFIYIVFFQISGRLNSLWQRFFISLLPFFIFTHFHPQWFLWIVPFFILDLVESNFKNVFPQVLILLSFVGMLFFFDTGLTIGLFSPLNPTLYDSATLWQRLGINIDYNFFRSILQTIFAGSALYFVYYYFPRKTEEIHG